MPAQLRTAAAREHVTSDNNCANLEMIGNRENKAKTPPSLHSCNYLIRCRMAVPDASLETSMCVLSKNVWYKGWASQLALNPLSARAPLGHHYNFVRVLRR